MRTEPRLCLNHVNQILRHALLGQNARDHWPVTSSPAQALPQRTLAPAQEVVHVAQNTIVDYQRQIRFRGQQHAQAVGRQTGILFQIEAQHLIQNQWLGLLRNQIFRLLPGFHLLHAELLEQPARIAVPTALEFAAYLPQRPALLILIDQGQRRIAIRRFRHNREHRRGVEQRRGVYSPGGWRPGAWQG